MNILLCRQILAERPYQYKKYSGELTRTWDLVTDSLSIVEGYAITTRQLRDHIDHLMKGRNRERNAELKLTGVEIVEHEVSMLLDEISEDMNGCPAELAEITEEEKERKVAEDIRTCAMETFGESKKRSPSNDIDNITPPRAKRRSGTETLQFLMENREFNKENMTKKWNFVTKNSRWGERK